MTDYRPDLMFIGNGFHAQRTEDKTAWNILMPSSKERLLKVKELHEFHEKKLSIQNFDESWSFAYVNPNNDYHVLVSDKKYKYADNYCFGFARVDCIDESGWTYVNKQEETMKHRFEIAFNFSNYWAVVKLKNTNSNNGWALVNCNGKIMETQSIETLQYATDPLKLALMKDPKNFFLLPDLFFLNGTNLDKYLKIADESVDSFYKENNVIYNKKNSKIIKQAFRAKIESVRNPNQENQVWEEFKTQFPSNNENKTLNQ